MKQLICLEHLIDSHGNKSRFKPSQNSFPDPPAITHDATYKLTARKGTKSRNEKSLIRFFSSLFAM